MSSDPLRGYPAPLALQQPDELNEYVELLCANNIRSYLEVGAKYGGTIYRVAQIMPVGSCIVAIDLPGGTKDWPRTSRSLVDLFTHLRKVGFDARIIWGNSTHMEVIRQAGKLGPYDAVLIDANHTAEYVRQDYAAYAPMARMVAFHDIAWKRPDDWKGYSRIDVPQFWEIVKKSHQHVEIRRDPSGVDNGFGVLWR